MLMREKLDFLLLVLISGTLIVTVSAFAIFASISEHQAELSQEKGIFQQNFLMKKPLDSMNRKPRPSGEIKPFPTPTFISYPVCDMLSCLDEALDRKRSYEVKIETGIGGTIKRVVDTSAGK